MHLQAKYALGRRPTLVSRASMNPSSRTTRPKIAQRVSNPSRVRVSATIEPSDFTNISPFLNPFLANRLHELEEVPEVDRDKLEASLRSHVRDLWGQYADQKKKSTKLEVEGIAKDSKIHRLTAQVKTRDSALARKEQTLARLEDDVARLQQALQARDQELAALRDDLDRAAVWPWYAKIWQ